MKSMPDRKAWGHYCRDHGLKNIGGGKAQKTSGFSSSMNVETYTLRKDGTVEGEGAPQPDEKMKVRLSGAYDEIVQQTMPLFPVPSYDGLPDIDEEGFDFLGKHVAKDAEGQVLYVVERRVNSRNEDAGKGDAKVCIPWFFYPDKGGWREEDPPEGVAIPLYGNGEHFTRSQVMIHEGEKAVDAANKFAQPDSGHPWQPFLAQYAHCTWKGGTIPGAMDKADWSMLEGKKKILIMPDNDKAGYEAAHRLRYLIHGVESMYIVHWSILGGRFDKTWDIADPVPGDVSEEMIESAFVLWENATERYLDDEGKVHHRLLPEFVKKFAYIEETDEIVERRRPLTYFKAAGFNASFGHLTPVGNLFKLMHDSNHLRKVTRPGYNPGFKIDLGQYKPPASLNVSSEGISYVNMYRPPFLKEREPQRPRGDWFDTVKTLRPFLTYMMKVLPNPRERKTVIRWLCHNMTVARAEDRAHWAVLMISEMEGTGKSTLGVIMKRLLGRHNVSTVEGAMVADKYTSWAENIQLAVVEELKEESAFRLTESLKTKISEATITIRRMHTNAYTSDNFMNLLAFSNHHTAVAISDTDRRWFIPEVTEKVVPWNKNAARRYLAMPVDRNDNAFFRELWCWFNGGGDKYLLWFMRRYGLRLQQVGWAAHHDRAPDTESKEEVKNYSVFDWQRKIADELKDVELVFLGDVMEWLKEQKLRHPNAEVVAEFLAHEDLKRAFTRPDLKDRKAKKGQVKAVRGTDGKSWIWGYFHTRDPELYVGTYNYDLLGHRVTWLSDKFRGLTALDRGVAKEEKPKTEEPITDAF